MKAQITVHAITNGAGEIVGWAVLRNKAEKLAEFEDVREACRFADEQLTMLNRPGDRPTPPHFNCVI